MALENFLTPHIVLITIRHLRWSTHVTPSKASRHLLQHLPLVCSSSAIRRQLTILQPLSTSSHSSTVTLDFSNANIQRRLRWRKTMFNPNNAPLTLRHMQMALLRQRQASHTRMGSFIDYHDDTQTLELSQVGFVSKEILRNKLQPHLESLFLTLENVNTTTILQMTKPSEKKFTTLQSPWCNRNFVLRLPSTTIETLRKRVIRAIPAQLLLRH